MLAGFSQEITSVEDHAASKRSWPTHGLRNYLFIRLRTDTGFSGIGEATLEWQEKTVETLLHEWVECRVVRLEIRLTSRPRSAA